MHAVAIRAAAGSPILNFPRRSGHGCPTVFAFVPQLRYARLHLHIAPLREKLRYR
jgi:hypothetical protein